MNTEKVTEKLNPVVTQAASVTTIIIVVKATLAYIQVMGWIDITPERALATTSFLETVLPIVAIWIGVLWTITRVTPLNNPKDKDGTELSRPGDVPVIAKIEKAQEEAIKINDKVDERSIVR